VIVLGVILLLIGWLTGLGILETLGIILLVIGLILLLIGSVGPGVGGRRWYY
jgi:membrane-bound ClpP family serine protease